MAISWKTQIAYTWGRKTVKEANGRIREDGVGAEFSHLLYNPPIGDNAINQTVRGPWRNAKRVAGELIVGRLLIIGDKGLTLQKTIISQKRHCK